MDQTARDLIAAACFALFVAGAYRSTRRVPSQATQKRRATVFTLYVLTVSFGAGIFERHLYPFEAWDLIAWILPSSVELTRFAVVGADGMVYDPDFRAWLPIGVDELLSWVDQDFTALDSVQKSVAAAWLLRRANDVAVRARNGTLARANGRLLGRFAAPYFILHPAPWNDPANVPPLPLRAFRIYKDAWSIETRNKNPERVSRRLIYEYHAE